MISIVHFSAINKQRSALLMNPGTITTLYQNAIADLPLNNRLPSMYERNEYVEAGGLMSYSTNRRISIGAPQST